jgi:hypothetical protein
LAAAPGSSPTSTCASPNSSGTTAGAASKSTRVDTGDDLTEDECFDTMPTDEQIAIRLEQHKPIEWWTCHGCGAQVDATQADLIVDHVRDCDLVDGAGNPTGGAS